MSDVELMTSAPVQEDAGIRNLARRFAATYAALVAERRQHVSEHDEEIERTESAYVNPGLRRRAVDEPVEEVSWWSLSPLIETDPEAGWAVWERVKAAAADELASGDRAALALCWDDSPWKRAQFLAIRQTFIDEWQPRGGIELTLIDQMTQAHSLYLHWVERAHVQASLEGSKQKRELGQTGRWQPRTLGTAETLDQSAQMAERWQKLFVRALRALRDLRRHAPPIVLAGPGSQVNVGHQQVNTTGATSRAAPESDP
jgi:hypothetical protein